MKLSELTAQYVTHKQSMGMRFCTEERTLKSFCRAMGNIAITEVQRDRVYAYIAGTGPVTRSGIVNIKCSLAFIVSPSHVDMSPSPRCPRSCLNRLGPLCLISTRTTSCGACSKPPLSCDNNSHSNIESDTCRTLILLLYGAGLRISEALALTLADVNLSAGILHIQASKFYKTRLVPLSPDLTCVLSTYATKREIRHPSYPEASFLFPAREVD